MKSVYDVIKKPIVTERSMEDARARRYTFAVEKTATKLEIKEAAEAIFGCEVESVNTMNYDGKVKRQGATSGRRPAWKKAIVSITEKSKPIEFFETMI
ncbi:MAG: 50S ribosomal protein L23 [Clostridiales bacterium]|jgi:large subunit ribosomal protein L23|nr:50S ribosomal protein L23 [Clostridiales bacterium]